MGFKQVAIKAATAAGRVLMDNFGKIKYKKVKSRGSYVTNVDLEAEKVILDIVRKSYPKHSILSEEIGNIDNKSDYKWIIDPLDGTHNYMHNLPLFGVSIALEYKGEIILGVISLPYFNELYVALKGEGAYLNNRKIKVSKAGEIKKSLLIFEGGFNHSKRREKTKFFNKAVKLFPRVRITGAAVVDLAYTAIGKADCHISFYTNAWDVAAGFLIIVEAGGRVTDLKGKAFNQYMRGFVASNGKIHEDVLRLL